MFLLPFILLALSSLQVVWGFLTPIFLAWTFQVLIDARSRRAAVRRGFWGMTVFFGIFLYWLPISFSKLYGPFGAAMFTPLFFIEGAFWALLIAVVFNLSKDRSARLWLLAFGWVVLEWLRHLGMFAFPWGTLGYTLDTLPIIQTADLGGILLLSLLVTVTAAAIVEAVSSKFAPLLVSLSLWAGGWVYGLTRTLPTGPEHQATLVQGNIDPLKKAADVNNTLGTVDIYNRLSQGEGLFIWPETAIKDMDLPLAQPSQLITGVADLSGGHNRVLSREMDSQQTEVKFTTHDKLRLVPFGEWIPWRQELDGLYDWVERQLGIYLISTNQGTTAEPLEINGQKFGTYICYESVYGWMARQMALDGANVLVNVSNDAWFGDGAGLKQHYAMGRVRAIETHRYILRAGNTGITSVIDPLGRTLDRLPIQQEGALKVTYQSLNGTTLYMLLGDWLVLGICLFGSVWVIFTGSRRARGLL